MERNEVNQNAMGGTELMMKRLYDSIDPTLLDQFQIIGSRVRELKHDKIRILWLHDLPEDPESRHLANGGWDKFNKLVFVSNWQMQAYIKAYDIPWDRCLVMKNAIEPIDTHEKPTDVINLAYWSTPHRGLDILVPVFEKLAEDNDNVHLHVFSSFNLYGWGERDVPFQPLFDRCIEHPKITYHGAQPNDVVREALKDMHILAYPSTWVETSCLVLMEAMSAGMHCVHSNLGALYETGAGLTKMYQYMEDKNVHAGIFYGMLKHTIDIINSGDVFQYAQKGYADAYYNWQYRSREWNALLESMEHLEPYTPEDNANYFTYTI